MRSRFLLAVTIWAVLVGCTSSRIRIEWTRPPQLVLPLDQAVAVHVEADGRPPTPDVVFDAIVDVGFGQKLNKWLAVLPVRAELDLQLRRAGHNVVEPDSAAVVVRVRPTRWSYNVNKNRSGGGRLEARIEVLNLRDPGGQPLFADGYWATSGNSKTGEVEAMARASRSLALAFLRSMQPSRVSARVELDDSDSAAEPGIELCRDGRFDAAYVAFSDAASRSPGSAPLLYNLAVLAEARGEYDLAESMLGRATGLEPKALYFEALDRVRRARGDSEAMNNK